RPPSSVLPASVSARSGRRCEITSPGTTRRMLSTLCPRQACARSNCRSKSSSTCTNGYGVVRREAWRHNRSIHSMKALACLFAAASLAAFGQKHTSENPRGQSPPPDESQSWTRGRLGTQKPLPGKVQDLTGILVDASCDDRTALNLARPPEQPE